MNVFVVDSHAIYRRGLVASLELVERIESVYQADAVARAWEHPGLYESEVVILDTSILGGRDFMRSVADSGARVVACTTVCSEEAVVEAMAAGAVGYLRKDTLTQDVLQAAVQAAEGGATVMAPDLLNTMLRGGAVEEREPRFAASPRLSDREQRVLALIAEGHPTREVAAELCFSERTVKNVLHDVATKLNARSRSQAVAHAVRDGLI